MRSATHHRNHLMILDAVRKTGSLLYFSELVLAPSMDFIRRITLVQVLFVSGMLKLSDW